MTGFHRLPILAIAALVAAGCGANPPISAPTEVASAAATSQATQEAPTAPATPQGPTRSPNTSCPPPDPNGGLPSPHFTVWTPVGGYFLGLPVTRVSTIDDPSQFIDIKVREPVYLDDPVRLAGGWRVGLDPDDDIGTSIALISASATLRTDGGERVTMDATVGTVPRTERPGFLFDVPDVRATSAKFTAEWSQGCFTYRAEKVWGLQMVRADEAARCPGDHKGYVAHWASMGEPPIRVGGTGVSLGRIETVGFWVPYAVSSQGNSGLATWDPSLPAATAEGGSTVPVVPASDDLTPVSLSAQFHRRAVVVADGSGAASVFSSTADPYPDGRFDLLVPSNPGRYVASLHYVAETPCAHVGSVGAVSIDIE